MITDSDTQVALSDLEISDELLVAIDKQMAVARFRVVQISHGPVVSAAVRGGLRPMQVVGSMLPLDTPKPESRFVPGVLLPGRGCAIVWLELGRSGFERYPLTGLVVVRGSQRFTIATT